MGEGFNLMTEEGEEKTHLQCDRPKCDGTKFHSDRASLPI